MDKKGNLNKGRVAVYQILIKYRGELSETFLDNLKHEIWEYIGDIVISDITIKRTNKRLKP